MSDVSYYYFKGFALAIDKTSYLVTVFQPDACPAFQNEATDLPDWVFHSRLTIWLGENGGNVYERSLNGELIRVALLAQRIDQELCRDLHPERSTG